MATQHHPRVRWHRAALAIAAWCLAAAAAAHDFIVVRAAVAVDGTTVTVTLLVSQGDLLTALGEKRLVFADAEELRAFAPRIADYLIADTHVRLDGVDLPLRYLGPLLPRDGELPPQITLMLRGEAAMPPTTTALRLDLLGEHRVPLIATVEIRAGEAVERRTVGRAEEVVLGPAKPVTGAPEGSAGVTVLGDLRLGFALLVPHGLEHVLLAICLGLLAPRWKPVLAQIAAFSVAQSLTFTLGWLAAVRLGSPAIDALITTSVIALSIDNLATCQPRPWRLPLVFACGLAHGLALAAEVPRDHVFASPALLNCGIAIGLLAVGGATTVLTGWAVNRQWYRRAVLVPASIAIVGLCLVSVGHRALMRSRPAMAPAATHRARSLLGDAILAATDSRMPARKQNRPSLMARAVRSEDPGSYLLSPLGVSSAPAGLTAVFGMGTGVTPPL